MKAEEEVYEEGIPFKLMAQEEEEVQGDDDDQEDHSWESEMKRRRLVERDIRLLQKAAVLFVTLVIVTASFFIYKLLAIGSRNHNSLRNTVFNSSLLTDNLLMDDSLGTDLKIEQEEEEDHHAVKILTHDTFETFIHRNKNNNVATFITFYAPWCQHCQHFLPAWEDFAVQVQRSNDLQSRMVVGQVDCVAQSELCREQKIMAFPTILWFTGNHDDLQHLRRYSLDRNVDKLIKYSRKVLGLLPPDNEMGKAYFGQGVLSKQEELEEEPKESDQEGEDEVEPEPEEPEPEEPDQEKEDEEENMDDKQRSVIQLNQYNFDSFLQRHNDVFVDFYMPHCPGCDDLAPQWEEFAESVQQNGALVTVAKVNCGSQFKLCLDKNVLAFPTLRWYDSMIHTDYRGEFTVEAFLTFATSNLALLPAHARNHHTIHTISLSARKIEESESTTAIARTGATSSHTEVVTLDYSNFHTVLSQNNLVFVNFHAPWCTFSQRLIPIWEELAHSVRHESETSSIVIAEVDCVQNERLCMQEHISAFPSLILYRKDAGGAIKYCSGPRSVDGLTSFLKLSTSVRSDTDNSRGLDSSVDIIGNDDDDVSLAVYSSYDLLDGEERTFSSSDIEDDVTFLTDEMEDDDGKVEENQPVLHDSNQQGYHPAVQDRLDASVELITSGIEDATASVSAALETLSNQVDDISMEQVVIVKKKVLELLNRVILASFLKRAYKLIDERVISDDKADGALSMSIPRVNAWLGELVESSCSEILQISQNYATALIFEVTGKVVMVVKDDHGAVEKIEILTDGTSGEDANKTFIHQKNTISKQ